MTGTTRARWTVRKVVGYLSLALLLGVLLTSAPRYEPWALVAIIAIPAAVGLIVGAGMILLRRGGTRPIRASRDPFREDASTDVINMARIRVAGFGGLGMVFVALVLAWVYPRIGQTLLIGLVGGLAVAIAVVVYRRVHGPLDSTDHGVGGRSVLFADRGGPDGDDDEPTPKPAHGADPSRLEQHAV